MKKSEEQLSDERVVWAVWAVWDDWGGWRGNEFEAARSQAGGMGTDWVRRGSSPDPATLAALVGWVGLGGRCTGAINGTRSTVAVQLGEGVGSGLWVTAYTAHGSPATHAVTSQSLPGLQALPCPALPFVFAIGQAVRHLPSSQHQSALDASAPKHSISIARKSLIPFCPPKINSAPVFAHRGSLLPVPVPRATAAALGPARAYRCTVVADGLPVDSMQPPFPSWSRMVAVDACSPPPQVLIS